MYRYEGLPADLFNIAAVSHPRLPDDQAFKALIARGLMHASARENVHLNVEFVTRAGQVYHRIQLGARRY